MKHMKLIKDTASSQKKKKKDRRNNKVTVNTNGAYRFYKMGVGSTELAEWQFRPIWSK